MSANVELSQGALEERRLYLELRVPRAQLRRLNLEALAEQRDTGRARLERLELHPPAAGPEAALIFGPLPNGVGAGTPAAGHLLRRMGDVVEAAGVNVLAAREVLGPEPRDVELEPALRLGLPETYGRRRRRG